MSNRTLNILVKGAGLAALGMVISKFLSYLYRAVVARMIGPEAYGQLSLALMVLNVVGVIAYLGLDTGMQKFIAKYREKNEPSSIRGTFLSAFHIGIPVALTMSAIMFLSADFVAMNIFESPELAPLIKVLAFVPPFGVVSQISLSTTLGFEKMKYRVLTKQVFQNIVQLLATVGFIYMGYGVVGAAGGWLVGTVLGAFAILYFAWKLIGPLKGTTRDYNHHELFNYSFPLLLSGVIGTLLGMADTALIGYFMDDASVGFYNAALPIAALILLPYSAFSGLALPSMSRVVESEELELSSVLKTLTRWTFLVSFPAAVLMILFSEQVLHLLFGREYTVASTALIILSLGYMFSTAVGHLGKVIKAIGRTEIIFRNTVGNLFLNIILNVILIPRYGIVGAAIATAVSTVFVNTLLLIETYYFERTHPFSRHNWKPVAAAIPGVILIYFALETLYTTVPFWTLVPGGIAFGVIYLLAVIGLGAVREEDRDIIVGGFRMINQEELGEKVADLLIR